MPPSDLPTPYSKEQVERMKALMGAADRRPSADGLASVSVLEIGKMGGFVDSKDKAKAPVQSIRIIPLVLRETRAYWARKGVGDAPDCRSIDGVAPTKEHDIEPQSVTCSACPWNKFGTAEQGKGKKCKTKGVLFAMEVTKEGDFIGPVVIRFSMGNRYTPASILGADRAAGAMSLPRFLTVWEAKTQIGHGAQDFIYFAPECVGKVPESKATEVMDIVERIANEQADQFLSASKTESAE